MKIYLMLFITLLLTSSSIFAQYNDEAIDETPYIYTVEQNAQGMYGLIRIADNKLVIPYMFSNIEITNGLETRNYATVYTAIGSDPAKLANAGIYSIKENKIIVPCKYAYVNIRNPDFYPNDDKYITKFCGFSAYEKIDNNNGIFHFYSRQGKLMASNEYEIDLSPKGKYRTDTIIGFLRNSETNNIGYFTFNAKTGIVYQQKMFKSVEYAASDKFVIVQNTDGKFGVINCFTGVFLIQPKQEYISEPGMCFMTKNGEQWSVINTMGKVTISPGVYDSIASFGCISNMKIRTCAFAVRQNGKWGAVSDQGKVVMPIIYDQAFEYEDSIVVSKNNKWGLVTRTGKEIIPTQYDSFSIEYYEKDDLSYYSVQKGKLWGCINTKGQEILPIEYDSLVVYADTMWVTKNGKTGCMDKDLKQIVDFILDPKIYDNFSFEKNGIHCTKSGEAIIMDKKGNEISNKTRKQPGSTNGQKTVSAPASTASASEKAWALHNCIKDNNIELFRAIMSTKPDVNASFNYTYTEPICQVAELARGSDRESTFKEMISSLIRCGSQLDYPNLTQGSPVQSYLLSNYNPKIDLLEYLLKAGCQVDKNIYSKLPSTSYSKEIKAMLKQYER